MAIKDDQLINEGFRKNPKPLFKGVLILALLFLAILGIQWGLKRTLAERVADSPFNRVTNREMAVFLWQNPEFMRVNSKTKSGYLPGFQYLDSVAAEPELAGEFVVAPPEVLFLYHTWKRQIGGYDFRERIEPAQFLKFLEYDPIWTPENWNEAPKRYVEMVSHLSEDSPINMTDLPHAVLPLMVRQAFVGWNNFFHNGNAIRTLQITRKEMQEFLEVYPYYSRPFWQNIVGEQYLRSLESGPQAELLPQDELNGFLKQAFFNSIQERSNLTE
ncbi:MAG: hypothetical protein KDK48_04970 [Chlamydiia bacterium]|nr:hypothetical protein [Chlamydiia bacterium]